MAREAHASCALYNLLCGTTFLKADMAIFKDDNNQRYLGILYYKTDDIYSGNFMKISERVFQRMLAFHWVLIRFMVLSIALTLCVFFYRIMAGLVGASGAIYIYIAIFTTAALVSYVLCTLLLIFSKVKIKKKKMNCITRPSVEIYFIVLLGISAVVLNSFLSGAMGLGKLLPLVSFTLLPVAILCCFAIFYYLKNEKIRVWGISRVGAKPKE